MRNPLNTSNWGVFLRWVPSIPSSTIIETVTTLQWQFRRLEILVHHHWRILITKGRLCTQLPKSCKINMANQNFSLVIVVHSETTYHLFSIGRPFQLLLATNTYPHISSSTHQPPPPEQWPTIPWHGNTTILQSKYFNDIFDKNHTMGILTKPLLVMQRFSDLISLSQGGTILRTHAEKKPP